MRSHRYVVSRRVRNGLRQAAQPSDDVFPVHTRDPQFVFAWFYAIAFYVVLVIAWFALLFTGRWPCGLYGFAGGFLRYITRLSAYFFLGVSNYPPFSGAEDDSYPVRVHIAPPLDRYSRLKVFFRPIYAILAIVIRYALGVVLSFVALYLGLQS